MTEAIIFFCSIFALFLAALALPAIRTERSWRIYFKAFLIVTFGIVLPLLVFVCSLFYSPDWKRGCEYGWIDCLHAGKVFLSPFVLWAVVALYRADILRAPTRTWSVLGIFCGAITSTLCFLHGMLTLGPLVAGEIGWGLLVPLYIAVWFCLRSSQLSLKAKLNLRAYAWSVLGMIPFWILAVWRAKQVYAQLPDVPDRGCFVVTAATRGHGNIVGPLTPVSHGDKTIMASRQLQTLWALEARWCRKAPISHRQFRRVYNRVGPVIARQIRHPLVADVACLVLKPIEWCAARIVGSDRSDV